MKPECYSISVASLRKFADRHLIKPGRSLVVGSRIYATSPDRRTFYTPNAIGLDMLDGPGVDIVHDLEQPLEGHKKFDHIDLCSVLEHVRRPWLLAHNVEKLLVRNGTLLVSVPFCWRVHAYPHDYWRMTPAALAIIFPSIHWLERKFLVGTELRKIVPGGESDGDKWIKRAETIAFGVRC